jgi:formate hydrogenlyase subunit 4
METVKFILWGLLNVAAVLALAPLCEGIIRKVTARIQSRRGPPLLQPYYDLLKLLGKEDIESGEVPLMQRLSAYLGLAAILTLAVLVPLGGPAPMGPWADAVLLIYVLTLSGTATLLAALSAGSVYSMIGMSREMMAMLTLEPLLAIAVVASTIHAGSLRLDAVLGGALYGGGFPLSGIILLAVGIFSLQAFVCRLPFDTAEAETEIMEGPLVEYSGPKLALFKVAQMSKLFVYCALFTALFLPWGNGLVFPLGLAITLSKVLGLVLLVTLVSSTHARYRIDQAVRYYVGLFIVSLAALVCAVAGY